MSEEWKLHQTFQASFGRIAYDVFGDGSPLVLVHGTSISSYLWRNVVEQLHLRSATSKEMNNDELEPYMKPWRGEEGQAAYFRAVAEYDDKYTLEIEPLYKDIHIPVMVMWGENDAWLPIETGRKLSQMIPYASFQSISDAGHFSPEDNPTFVANHIRKFLL